LILGFGFVVVSREGWKLWPVRARARLCVKRLQRRKKHNKQTIIFRNNNQKQQQHQQQIRKKPTRKTKTLLIS